ncbi:hypothetical protein SAMN05444972_1193 [Marininema halotolerans]|uniref:DksA C4-type domain-containing protein n=1 Tax=Marininema halotolerans TaxID=1155944 RepID=A0A1I6UQA0_9BACL|nr:hypothetical protein SAMN05444972_1193 [Marininema halotolerans]
MNAMQRRRRRRVRALLGPRCSTCGRQIRWAEVEGESATGICTPCWDEELDMKRKERY